MAFNEANLSVGRHVHENGVTRIFEYTTSDSWGDTRGAGYFDERFFQGGDIILVTHSGGSYVGIYNSASAGILEA